MKWYLNMKIGKKLVTGFILVSLISAAMGLFSAYNLKTLDDADTQLYENMTVPLSEIAAISTEFQRTRVNARDMINAQTPEDIQANIVKIQERMANIDQLSEEFQTTIHSDQIQQEFDAYAKAKNDYYAELNDMINLAKENRDAEALTLLSEDGAAGIASRAEQDAIDKIVTQKVADAKQKSDANTSQANHTITVTLIVIGIMIIVSILIGLLISRMITKPLKRAVRMMGELSSGHMQERLHMDSKDEIGQMARAMDYFADELQTKVVGVMDRISDGDVDMEIVLKDEKDEIAPAIKKTVDTIRALNDEVQNLINAAIEGKLDIRGKSDGYSGSWENLISGINGLIDAFVAPINLTAEYVERISKGDIPPEITDTYLGDFNEIKNNLNGCIEVMNGLLSETNQLTTAIRKGKLDVRGNQEEFSGEWGSLVEGINHLIDAFVAPINVTAEYIERVSKGDIPEKISETYYGDFNEIKNNLNGCVDIMGGLVRETNALIQASREGKLDVRGDSTQFYGVWTGLVDGINDLINAFVSPINLTAEYIDRISKGDIPPKITDNYLGDFNEIKNNLNHCVDIMSGLQKETNKLIGAAQEGQLDVRANTEGFTGGWEELVSGMNRLVESIVKPIKEVTMVMHEISDGNLSVSVNGNYQGEFGVLSGAVNRTARDLNLVVSEISGVIGQISEGNLTTSQIREYKGDFVNISNSLNAILESLNSILGEINMASEQVSIGSKQVSDGSQALSQGATEQASSVEQLTSSVTEVAAKTKENAGSANKANELTLAVKDHAEKGNRHMSEMLQAMEEINESSSNISRIIKVIDDIAFQTNILALNAAVEAARAGQHGKGFAVVAEEVRTLAARSADAAKETTDLIQGSINKSSRGTEIANNTAGALNEIVDGISKTAEIIAEIAQSSNEQAMGISQINTGLNQVSQVVQNNAATAEESAASSQELSGQAEMMKSMVGKFKLRTQQYGGSIEGKRELRLTGSNDPQDSPKIVLDASEADKY